MKTNIETIKLFISALIFFASIYFFVDSTQKSEKKDQEEKNHQLITFNIE